MAPNFGNHLMISEHLLRNVLGLGRGCLDAHRTGFRLYKKEVRVPWTTNSPEPEQEESQAPPNVSKSDKQKIRNIYMQIHNKYTWWIHGGPSTQSEQLHRDNSMGTGQALGFPPISKSPLLWAIRANSLCVQGHPAG